MAFDDTKIRKGQAYNNAMEDARHAARMGDMRYIVQRYMYHLETAALFQKASTTELGVIVDKPELVALFQKFHEELS